MLPNIAWAASLCHWKLFIGFQRHPTQGVLTRHKCPPTAGQLISVWLAGFSAMAISQSPSSFRSSPGQLTQYVGTGFSISFPNSGDTGRQSLTKCCQTLEDAIGASGQKREQVSLRVKSTASLHGGPFFTTNCLSQVKQICKPHSLRANLIVSAEIHSFLWRRASRLKAQHLSWQPLHFFVYHSYFMDFPEGVGKHLPYICLAKTPVVCPRKMGESCRREKKIQETHKNAGMLVCPQILALFLLWFCLLLWVPGIGLWALTHPITFLIQGSLLGNQSPSVKMWVYSVWKKLQPVVWNAIVRLHCMLAISFFITFNLPLPLTEKRRTKFSLTDHMTTVTTEEFWIQDIFEKRKSYKGMRLLRWTWKAVLTGHLNYLNSHLRFSLL